MHASHTAARGRGAQVPQPSSWPYGGDTIPIVDGKGGKAKVVKTDITGSNGVIHVIDTVLIPADVTVP